LQNNECHATFHETEPKNISVIHLSYDGSKILLGYTNGSIKIIDANTKHTLLIQNESTSSVSEINMGNDQTIIIVGHNNGCMNLFNATTGQKIHALKHPSKIASTQLSRNNQRAISIDERGTAKVWDAKTGKCRKILKTADAGNSQEIQISADGKLAILSFTNGTLKLVNLTNGQLLHTLTTDQELYQLSPISSDGTTFVTGSDDRVFRCFNLNALPHERIHDAAQAALNNAPDAQKKFEELPVFVQQAVNSNSYHRRHCSEPCYAKGPTSEANKRVYEGLCKYSQETFLPGILEYFEKANSPKREECFASAALHRCLTLPEETQNLMYWKLAILHQKKETGPKNKPENYGQLAFHNMAGFSATHKERIQVIKELLSSHTTDGSSAQKKQRTETAK